MGFLAYDPPARRATRRAPTIRTGSRTGSFPGRSAPSTMQRWRNLKYWESAGHNTQAMLAQPLRIASAPSLCRRNGTSFRHGCTPVPANTGKCGSTGMRRGLPAAFHLSEEDEVARVSPPNEVWNKGVAAANPKPDCVASSEYGRRLSHVAPGAVMATSRSRSTPRRLFNLAPGGWHV
jgi:hypothetical protein